MLSRTLLAISLAACLLHTLAPSDVPTSSPSAALWEPTQPFLTRQTTDRPKRPGVKDPSVRIPIERLKPDHVYDVPCTPDWIAIDEHVWVSNEPKHTVTRSDTHKKTSA